MESTIFNLRFKNKEKIKIIKNINVKLLGKHNVMNAASAFIVCLNLGINLNAAKNLLKIFQEYKEG